MKDSVKNILRPLYFYFTGRLPERSPSDKYLLPYLSFWTQLVLKKHRPVIIGITGTAGKTTLTQMIAHVLMQEAAVPYVGRVDKTIGNYNGDYGLRLSILRKMELGSTRLRRIGLIGRIPILSLRQVFNAEYPNILVLEYATFAAGHIHDLVRFAPPQIGILTNIGPAHLERHKNVEGVYLEKRALVQGVPKNGLIVLGAGHEFVARLIQDAQAPVKIVEGQGVELAENITRVVCAELKVPEVLVEEGLKTYVLPHSRLNRIEVAGITYIDDAYNANPLSMKLGLEILAGEKTDNGRRIAILGCMAELGELSQQYHQEIGEFAKTRTDLLIGVGEGAQQYHPQLWFPNPEACAADLGKLLHPGDVVLIKGSQASKMSKLVKAVEGWEDQRPKVKEVNS